MDARIRRPRLDSLTSLRGLGALWVVGCHMAISLPRFNKYVIQLFQHGWLAVDFFFILSGFVISYSYLDIFSGKIKIKNVLKFLSSRFLRIYPIAFIVLVFLWLPCFTALKILHFQIDPQIISKRSFFLQLFLLNGIGLPHSQTGWNGPTWALSSEFVMYCCFPFLTCFIAMLKSIRLNLAFMAIIMGILILLSIFITHGRQFMIGDEFVLLRTGSEFILGCLVFNLYALSPPKHFIFEVAGWFSIGLVIVFSAIKIHPVYHFIYLILFSIIIYAFTKQIGLSKRLLENKVLIRLGQLSFSIYVIHYFILSINRSIIKIVIKADTLLVNIGFVLFSLTLILISSTYLYKLEELIRNRFKAGLRI